jgi:hypothetical protein
MSRYDAGFVSVLYKMFATKRTDHSQLSSQADHLKLVGIEAAYGTVQNTGS